MSDPAPRLARSRSRWLIAVVATLAVAIAVTEVRLRQMRTRQQTDVKQHLRTNLHVLRSAIAAYKQKHGRGPSSLRDLVSDHELSAIPIDPVTSAADWQVTAEETVGSNEFTDKATASTTAIVDVHSSAAGYASY